MAQGIRAEPVVFSAGSRERTRDGQLTFLNERAEMWWKVREALDPQYGDGIALPPDKRLAAQLAAPTWRLRGNAIVIESKEDIYKRLGASTDDADAVILAWHKRDEALRRQTKPRLDPGRAMGPDGWGCEMKKYDVLHYLIRTGPGRTELELARATHGDKAYSRA